MYFDTLKEYKVTEGVVRGQRCVDSGKGILVFIYSNSTPRCLEYRICILISIESSRIISFKLMILCTETRV